MSWLVRRKKIVAPRKVSQAQIQQRQVLPPLPNESKRRNLNGEPEELPIEENVNRLKIDSSSARNVDDAIHVLQSSHISVDKHPEKRTIAAYDADETENLPKLNQEHATLRLSQLKQLLEKEWMKSLENLFNKPTTAYNQGIHFK